MAAQPQNRCMCGICGQFVYQSDVPPAAVIGAMCRAMVHRGPDDEGIYTARHIGLGQRRLSIIDLARSACPPLANELGTVHVVFNGEIYNFQQLRAELEALGHRFATKTDTEVIVHLYEEEGVRCLDKLRGMFAFALWDDTRKMLFCARDRLGKKPLFYTSTPRSFIFGSTIKSVLANPEVSVAPEYHAIGHYLTYQFVPSPLTAFAGIMRLGPGEYLTCDRSGRIERNSYWAPPLAEKTEAAPEDVEAEVLSRLREAVRMRMVSDVPLGAFLSGGIDSAIIVALMAQESSRPVKTFTIGFDERGFNEVPYARLVARRYGTEHHELVVKPDAAQTLPLLVQHYCEPFADSSALPTYYVAQMTREHVTVALSGDGGDESFAGYNIYARLLRWQACNAVPTGARKAIGRLGRSVLAPFGPNNTAARVRRALAMFEAGDVRTRRLLAGTLLKPEEKQWLYTPRFRNLLANEPVPKDPLAAYPWRDGMDALDWLMRHDQAFYLPDCLMVKTDVASMANSLEVRCPFLDHKVVELAATIPSRLKLDSTGGKAVLRRAAQALLPAAISAKPKTGFAPPLTAWLRGPLAATLKDTLLDERTRRRGLLEPAALARMVDEHVRGRRDWSNRLWAFLFLELWFREFID